MPSPIAPAVPPSPNGDGQRHLSSHFEPHADAAFRPVYPRWLTGVVHAWQTWNNCGPATLDVPELLRP